MKLRDHPQLRAQWPPDPGAATPHTYKVPEGGRDVVAEVVHLPAAATSKANIELRTTYEGQSHSRYILLDDAQFAEKLASRLRKEIGRMVADLGDIEVDF